MNQKRGMQLIERMRGRRMAVVGDWMLDRYVWGKADRISPEAAVPVVDFVKQTETLGGAGNVAANLAALEARVEVFGLLGNDEAGEILKQRARAMKLGVSGLVEVKERPTTLKTRIIARQQQVVRIDREWRTHADAKTEAALLKKIRAALPQLDALVISDYDKGVVSDSLLKCILESCVQHGIRSFIKPKWSRRMTFPGATAVICNRAEAGFLVSHSLDSAEAVSDGGRALLEQFGSGAVVITRGADGLSVFERDSAKAFHVAAVNQEMPIGMMGKIPGQEAKGRQVFDVTGAGDTVLAVMALASAAGATLPEAAELGNAAAGVVVAKLGTATLNRGELEAVLREIAGWPRAAES